MKSQSIILVITTAFWSLNCVWAHQDEHGDWKPISAGPVTTWTAPLCGKYTFVVQPYLFYNQTRGTFDPEGDYDSLTEGDRKYQYQEQLFMQYGLTDKLEIDGQTVYQQNYAQQGGLKAHARGFGDSYLYLRYCGIEEQRTIPHVTGVFQLKLPTGKYQHATLEKNGTDLMGATSGGGSYDHGYGLNLTKKLQPLIIHADAIYSLPTARTIDAVKTRYANYVNYDFGCEYFLPKGFNLMLEFNGFWQGDKKEDDETVPGSDINYVAIAPGIGYSNKKIQTLLAYQRTLAGTNADANDSVIFTLVYVFN